MNKNFWTMASLLCIAGALYFYTPHKIAQNRKTTQQNTPAVEPERTAPITTNESTFPTPTNAAGQPIQSASELYQPDWSTAEKQRHFRQARNTWIADPTLSTEQKEQYIKHLAKQLWGDDAPIPEQTQADRDHQQRINESLLALQSQVERVNSDQTLSQTEKKLAMRELFLQFVGH